MTHFLQCYLSSSRQFRKIDSYSSKIVNNNEKNNPIIIDGFLILFSLQTVYDKDLFSVDDKMGEADIDIKPYIKCKQMGMKNLPNGCSLKRIQADRTNCLAEESSCVWQNGKIIQEMILRLKNVECGELVVEIEWVDIVG